jgi:hypothetical protein
MDICGQDTVILVRREVAGRDRYGSDVLVDHETVVPGCSMQPMWGQESTGRADEITERFMCYVPGLALVDLEIDPNATDAVRFQGVVYEINGEPQPWHDQGVIDHVVLFCRRSTG